MGASSSSPVSGASTVSGGFRVSAARLVRQFGEYRGRADREPVLVTSYGRVTHALIAIDRLQMLENAAHCVEPSAHYGLAGALLADLGPWLDLGLIVCDAALHVEAANHVAAALAGRAPGDCVNRPFAEAFPAARDTILAVHAARTAASRAPSTAEFPSPFAPENWLRLRSFWWRERVVILLADITQEVWRERFADESASIMDSISLLPGLGHCRLSQRGTIDRVDGALPEMLGLAPDRLKGVPFADLIDLGARAAFRAALEERLHGEGAARLATRLISNHGVTVPAEMAIAPLLGSYGVEGAALIVQRSDSPESCASSASCLGRA